MKQVLEILHDRRKILSLSAFGIACLAIGVGISLISDGHHSRLDPECVQTYHFINKRYGCLPSEESDAEQIAQTEHVLNELVNRELNAKSASDISVYFRDLTNTKWIGVNQNENYAPGSLLKLPLLIAYFKYATLDPRVLNQTLIYKGPKNNDPDKLEVLPQPKMLEDGREYTIAELLAFMIQESSNAATAVLYNSMNQTLINDVYDDLGVALPINGSASQQYVSAATYANIFRSLYNASYLSRDYSEKTLEIMSGASFKDGIVAGVPAGTVVSHKFGDREVKDAGGNVLWRELHDCGIVYKKNNEYILCIMTKGDDFGKLKQVIQDISRLVYDKTT